MDSLGITPRKEPPLLNRSPKRLALSCVTFAAIELKSGDSCVPVEATGGGVIFVGVPERAIIHRINRHAAVISPAFERIELCAATVEQHQRA